jgi:LPS-assembly lipoprotein
MKKYLLVLLFLASCGLRPIYKISSEISDQSQNYKQELASIKVEITRKKLNQNLKNNLEKILNPEDIKTDPKYLITVSLQRSLSSTFTNFTGSSGRNKVTLTAKYQLKDLNSEEIIAAGSTTANDDFDVENKRFANYITEETIADNLTLTIARNIRNLLINDIVNNYKNKDKERKEFKDKSVDS